MAMQIIKGVTLINKAIDSIKNRGAKLDSSIQLAGLSVLAHASEHGDTTCADRLIQAMPKGGRKLALVEWMLAYGQIRKLDPKQADEAARIKEGATFKLDRARTLDLESAQAKAWHEFKPEPSLATAFDAQAAVAALIARLKKAQEGGLTIEHKSEALAQAKALVQALEQSDVKEAVQG
jgi:hypothetical protein